MDTKAIARKIREAIFDQAEQDGRVLHGDSIDATIERVLAAVAFDAKPEGHQTADARWTPELIAALYSDVQPYSYRPIIQGGTEKTVNA